MAEILEGINPLTYIPFLKDIWSIAQGFDIERSDMSLFSDLTDSAKTLVKIMSKDTTDMDEEELKAYQHELAYALIGISGTIGSMAGIPIKNIFRDAKASINLFDTLNEDFAGRKTTAGSLLDELQEEFRANIPIIGWLPGETKTDKLYDAIVSGDSAYVQRFKNSYDDDASFNNAIRKGLKENDPRITAAALAKLEGDISEYARLANEVVNEGKFSLDNVRKAVDAQVSKMEEKNTESNSSKTSGMFEAYDLVAAVTGDDAAMANAIKVDIIQTEQKNGKSQKEAETAFYNALSRECKEAFLEGDASESEVIKILSTYGNRTYDEAYADVRYWEFKENYPDVYADDSWFDKYYEEVSSSGIDIGVYMSYRNKIKGIDGKGKKEAIIQVIDSLPISSAQKDVLYLSAGYAENKLRSTPWNQ